MSIIPVTIFGSQFTSAERTFLAHLADITYAQGDVLYFDGSNLTNLPAGTNGYVLMTGGPGANPSWTAASGGANTALSNLASVAVNVDILPGSDGAIYLGSITKRWINLYLATNGFISFGTGGVQLSGVSGGTFTVTANAGTVFTGTITPFSAQALGTATASWTNLFLATGSVINFANGNAVITHSSAIITVTTGDLRVTSANVGTNADSVPTLSSTSTFTNKTLTSPKLNENVAVTTTATKLNLITSAAGTTGTTSTNIVFSTSPTLTTPVLGVASATSLATSAASPFLLTNGQLVTIALTSQTTGGTTLTIPDFASVSDEFTFKTKSQTMSNKTFVAPVLGAATATSINSLTISTSTGTFTLTNSKTLAVTNTLTLSGTDSTTMTFPSTTATIARTDAAQTFTGTQTFSQIVTTSNAITATANAATVPITSRISTVTNSSAATLTITITTTSAVDGQMVMVRILDFSAVAQTVTWVNTENSTVTAPTTSNGSTTLPLTVGFQYNNATSKWRCIASA